MKNLLYTLMGIGAIVLVTTPAVIGGMILRHGARREPIVFASGLGLILGSVLGGATAMYLSAQTGHWVGGAPTDAEGLPIFGWSRLGGDLRVAHFFGLHLMQALPAAAWLGARLLPQRGQMPAILLVAILGSLLTIATFAQAILGRPFLA